MRVFSLLLGVLVPLVAAQNQLTSSLSSYPACAQVCILHAFTAQFCSPLDSVCICTDPEFRTNVTDCVKESCTVIEALSTQNTSFNACGAPVTDRSHFLIVQSFTMFSFAMLLTLVRMGYKLGMRMDIGMDDWIVLVTTLTIIPQLVLFMTGTLPNGLGRDMWTLTADQITNFLRYWYIVAILYFLQTALIKLAFVAFYMRIFTTQSTKRILWATFVAIVCWGLSFIFVGIFVCTPISYLWTQWDGMHEGKCLSDAAYVWANAVSNIVLDFWVLAIPLWELRKLQLHWKKKVGVALMFSLGACVTVMSILRLKSLVLYTDRDNVTRAFSEIYLWSSIEMGVGIICACLPTMRLLLVKLWPVLAGTTVRDSSKWYRKSGKESQTSRTTGRTLSSKPLPPTPTFGINGVSRSVSINGKDIPSRTGQKGGISVEETFVMQHQERSDISLIIMKPHSHV